ncbi:MAG: hypothetical protein EOS24_15490 [Mesorhizobium sp.]|uniref:phage head-tail joining protein n=1 Tax=Mesorhizobium sp. TaxID=1871066 RepID=UPI000FE5661D|nr:hypothetical protein [Mesorhizobium sp.]RWE59815.1 MAG: hypothetical protein EOS24_15490 [Mesorhizobium sp.]
MADLDLLLAQKAALKKAMRSGALIVRHGDKSVQYRSLIEMKTALSDLEDEILEESGTPRKRLFYINARRGY